MPFNNLRSNTGTQILVVDDNSNNRLSLRCLIDEYFNDVKVCEADSGITALGMLMKEKVDLILLDIQMPQMDGFETAKMIQSRPKTKHIPIVFLTAAFKSEEFKKKGYEVGAVDYLTKPIDTLQLKDKINTYLHFVQQQHLNPDEEEIEQKVQERIATLAVDKPQFQNTLNRMEINDICDELQSSTMAIIEYSQILEKEASSLAMNHCVPEIAKIRLESMHISNLINNTLLDKLKSLK